MDLFEVDTKNSVSAPFVLKSYSGGAQPWFLIEIIQSIQLFNYLSEGKRIKRASDLINFAYM